ncbi:MAG TPA: hypothetical protein PKD54_07040 [Pirellulaceae bacterium]|nr:hypothetical protein [Pirellulaceae bacterium]
MEIEFGASRQREPSRSPRPEQNPGLAVQRCGLEPDGQLDVYADLDVWQDIWEHARSNTRVELGGVLMGRIYIDHDGRNFVIVQGSIRAEHYEATPGSFKFTHESWSEITRQQQLLPPEQVMVGWYHTHPGFGVFLSSLDEFICENFFGGSHDVALVLDPKSGDSGWFVRSDTGALHKSSGFFVTVHRRRGNELAEQVAPADSARTELPGSNQDQAPNADEVDQEPGSTATDLSILKAISGAPGLVLIGLQSLAIIVLAVLLWQAGTTPGRLFSAPSESMVQTESAPITLSENHRRRETTYRELISDSVGLDTVTLFPPRPANEDQIALSPATIPHQHEANGPKTTTFWIVWISSAVVVAASGSVWIASRWARRREAQRRSQLKREFATWMDAEADDEGA